MKQSGAAQPGPFSRLLATSPKAQAVVIDTNIVLDMLVFEDTAAALLRQHLTAGSLRWLATEAMRAECARVLGYPQIAQRLEFYGKTSASVMHEYDTLSQRCAPAQPAPYCCKDPDDQIYIDLACAYQAPLLSKDKHILALRGRLKKVGVALNPELRVCVLLK